MKKKKESNLPAVKPVSANNRKGMTATAGKSPASRRSKKPQRIEISQPVSNKISLGADEEME